MTTHRKRRGAFLFEPRSWPIVVGMLVPITAVLLLGLTSGSVALELAGWVLVGLYVLAVLARAFVIETRAAAAEGLSSRAGVRRFLERFLP